MASDGPFIERLQRLWGPDVFAGEFSHANEHSIEFQAVYLRSLGVTAPMAWYFAGVLMRLGEKSREFGGG